MAGSVERSFMVTLEIETNHYEEELESVITEALGDERIEVNYFDVVQEDLI